MLFQRTDKMMNGVFITFSGNCKKALQFYQNCFGGKLYFEAFKNEMNNYSEQPIVIGSLISDMIVIHGSDLVHNEGRQIGNYLSIFLHCNDAGDRKLLIHKLKVNRKITYTPDEIKQSLIEITDAFDVRWILAI